MSKKRLLMMISLFLLILSITGCAKARTPADTRLDALSAYKALLEKMPAIDTSSPELTDASFSSEQNLEKFGDHCEYFAIRDINQDDIPELITLTVINFRWNRAAVYTYAGGETMLLKDPDDAQSPATFEQNSSANGTYEIYFCEDGHMHNVWRGTTPAGEMKNDRAFVLDGTSLSPAECSKNQNEKSTSFFDIAELNTEENRALLQ